ncbi:MAG: redox-regulated ATPase YchF [Candidatus Magasanikbacteria bacterium CG_4_9_14_0_2_um_filter_41_10]|uniref:Ribosome-binding ATPase YchF n=1 Tax=Candidatus Magasanikbacteria bacterium CG_4_10_14_0_2_um_filter_41_31 TaxID=1974639 RepID=A0A2M7V2X0_9BACT|nr:MAG: redox-regulated ATPase YchF [Candidatus Magasanikbacteria bacterium CG1_02_41_34]PIZ92815.1 MAG: redox-regulated ATPase YchF [Candidatus Magasanikbacteria bacterium CG_4_10_14_0_2_um_filter_41_31]PJC53449.1 MAG: redox-regulated ATPase YchF [Candidatus Magasanikbacteria bacterium CG_4_9_14_0_2_um_filter_41_10]
MLAIGIVGLPNVGKSTLFNALTKSKQADAQNYPFCTIEPNIGIVEVPDKRIAKLTSTSVSLKAVPTAIEFVDIAGLVKGASEGEGLGNKFLSHIRNVDAIAQVVRSFADGNVTHVHNKIDPKDDADVINLELVLADMQSVSSRLAKVSKDAKGVRAKELAVELALLEKLMAQFEQGKPARTLEYTEDEMEILKELHLITMKPMMYILNTEEEDTNFKEQDANFFEEGAVVVRVSAKIEAEIAELSEVDAVEFMKELGMDSSGLDKIITAGYKLLDLVTYFTSGVQETRAWTVKRHTPAQLAAGVIHTDFIKKFIKADIANWQDFVEAGGWNGVKEKGKMQLVGKEYVVQDGDVAYFHIGA